jgi:hypothetical protein
LIETFCARRRESSPSIARKRAEDKAEFVGGLDFDQRRARVAVIVEHCKQVRNLYRIVGRVFQNLLIEPMDEAAPAKPAENGGKLDFR